MTYHINLDGKILSCRAKIRKCPYGRDRHAEEIETLYQKAAEEYRIVEYTKTFEDRLKHGVHLDGFKAFEEVFQKQPAPIEALVEGLRLGVKYADASNMPKSISDDRKYVIETAASYYEASATAQSLKGIPYSMNNEAMTLARERGKREGFFSSIFSNKVVSPQLWEKTQNLGPSVKRVKKWEQDHADLPKYTKEETAAYKKWVNDEFNYYSSALNLSKLITKPTFKNRKDLERIVENLPKMSETELYSLYDDLNVVSQDLNSMLKTVKHFKYTDRNDISKESNAVIRGWFDRQQTKLQNYQLRNSANVLVSMSIAKEFMLRDKVFQGEQFTATYDNDIKRDLK